MNLSVASSLPNIEVRSEEIAAAEAAFPDADQSNFRHCYIGILCRIREQEAVLPELLDGLLVHHPKYRQCPFKRCGKDFKRRDRARAHIRKHLEDRAFACDGECGDTNCQQQFFSKAGLNTHRDQRVYECERCHRTILQHNKSRHVKSQKCQNAQLLVGGRARRQSVKRPSTP